MSLVYALVAWAPILAAAFAFVVHLLQVMRFASRHASQGLFRKGPESYPGFLRRSVEHTGWAGGMLTHRRREDTVAESSGWVVACTGRSRTSIKTRSNTMKVHRTRIGHCRDPSSSYLAGRGRMST